jgi:hypothetical protein
MIPEDLLFWIAPLARTPEPDENVLCRRHADAMMVPRGWTLDDRRDQTPRLFKPRPPARPVEQQASPARRSSRKRPSPEAPAVEQLVLDGTGDNPRPSGEQVAATERKAPEEGAASDESVAQPWSPAFDQDDDLNGLLQVDSPLLARAFRGTGRPRH